MAVPIITNIKAHGVVTFKYFKNKLMAMEVKAGESELVVGEIVWLKNGLKNGQYENAREQVTRNFIEYMNNGFSKKLTNSIEALGMNPEDHVIHFRNLETTCSDNNSELYVRHALLPKDPRKVKLTSVYYTKLDYSLTDETHRVDETVDSTKQKLAKINELLYKNVIRKDNVAEFIEKGLSGLGRLHFGTLIGLLDPRLKETIHEVVETKEHPTEIYKKDRASFEGLYHFLGYDAGIEMDYIFKQYLNDGATVNCIMTKSKSKKNLTIARVLVDNSLKEESNQLMKEWLQKT